MIILLAVSFVLYFIPTVVAIERGHHNKLAIFLLNLFAGWSIIGWIAALVWAATSVKPSVERVIYVQSPPPLPPQPPVIEHER